MPAPNGTVHRLLWGTTTVKLVSLDENPVVQDHDGNSVEFVDDRS